MTVPGPLTRAQLDALRDQQLAFLTARLATPAAAAEWRANLEAVYAELLGLPVGRIVDAARLNAALDAALTAQVVEGAGRPLTRLALAAALTELRAHPGTLGEHVPPAARRKLDRLLERPGLTPERLLREIGEQDAVEEVMRDVLYETLHEFSAKVNPFFAEWGLPALLKKLSPFGFGVGKGFETMRAEFDRRLEPEIRKFLQTFARKALRKTVEVTIAKGDEPKFVALRKRLVAWALEQQVATLARELDGEALALAAEIGADLAAHADTLDALRQRRHALVAEAVAARREQPLGEALAELGVTARPDFDALGQATWPLVQAALGTEPARRWLAALIGEFFDGIDAG